MPCSEHRSVPGAGAGGRAEGRGVSRYHVTASLQRPGQRGGDVAGPGGGAGHPGYLPLGRAARPLQAGLGGRGRDRGGGLFTVCIDISVGTG